MEAMGKPSVTPRTLDYWRRINRRVPRPVWSAWWLSFLGVAFGVLAAIAVKLTSDASRLTRWEELVGIFAGGLWLALACGLYYGVRIRKREEPPPIPNLGDSSAADWVPDVDVGAIDHPIALVVGLIVVPILAIWLLPLLLTAAMALVVLLVSGLAIVARPLLRRVFLLGPRCRGRLWPSIKYATAYTAAYVGWVLVVLLVVGAVRP